MRLVSFVEDGTEHLGVLDGQDVTRLGPASGREPVTLARLISEDISIAGLLSNGQDRGRPLSELHLLPPLPQPQAIFCVGVNYADHAKEAPVASSDYPTIFLRLARNQIPHGAPMISPAVSSTLDWEGELVAVIGRGGRHIPAETALDHLFGYSIYNEASVREFQHHSSQFGMGKNFEGTGAFGPCVVTADAFGDPYAHSIVTRINGQIVQEASISEMIHKIEDVIAYVSSATTLMPGDLICTGTPSGVGAARKPQRFMQPGDTVTVEIDGIGTLTNPVHAETALAAQ